MPTADDFEAAAWSFERAAEQLTQLMEDAPSHFGPETLQDGTLTMVAEVTVATAQVTATTVARAAAASAATCRARAAACRAFAADLADYHRQLTAYEHAWAEYGTSDPFAPSPVRPQRPRPSATFIEI